MESFEDFGLKIGIYSCLNEVMKNYEVKVISWPLVQIPHILTFSTISAKDKGPVVNTFHIEPPGVDWIKICSNGQGHMTNMAAITTYGINL